ncbi:single-stranded-DNA-specific exonuclease RecJ [Methyloradius palustris]|uniref:Single-stranded-DNA-specific exonuclease RecJ n=1 Tax=Methyloradius palustris TaxID=2778876 RepID=A0A8D5G3W3_9PROT|nr:single-stranded-DNA-specific exonuclease RecJ [Methyloradius palustris]BCM25523.1 single-stranded-DNA-specific exonuclease [Methyloradius palustris]
MVKVVERSYEPEFQANLVASGIHPALARVLAARGIAQASQLESSLTGLIAPEKLTNAVEVAKLLADAIAQNKSLLVIGDYDADGATATAVAMRGLRSMGAKVDFLVPNRFEYGYGLTPEIVALAATRKPDIIITVDNGIASVEGVDAANKLGIAVLVTDHHLPADTKPDAACIVNPNQHGCDFPSKNLAGVGVIFYVMLALRAELRTRGAYVDKPEPNLTELLDIVALGTVADLVKLDENNRILVDQGLRRIRAAKGCPAIRALLKVAGRNPALVTAQDLGFSVGPRLNAAGRLDDMSIGIHCLLTDNEDEAQQMAQKLHEMNATRRDIQSDMQDAAMIALDDIDASERFTISLYDTNWHQGVIGILASRIKELHHRPVVAFANAGDGILKGSARSIAGLHLRDALDLLSKKQPDLLLRFGGHAMAAGLSIREADFNVFNSSFEAVVAGLLTPADLESVVEVDGALDAIDMGWDMAAAIERQVWGQGFPQPMFQDEFKVLEQRIVGEKHLKLTLGKNRQRFDAIFFQQQDFLPENISAVYQLQTNQYNGKQSVQLALKHWQPAI